MEHRAKIKKKKKNVTSDHRLGGEFGSAIHQGLPWDVFSVKATREINTCGVPADYNLPSHMLPVEIKDSSGQGIGGPNPATEQIGPLHKDKGDGFLTPVFPEN